MSEDRYKLEDLIQTLCTTGSNNLDQVVLKEIKTLCKNNDLNCQYSYEILMTYLNKDHSEVRFSAFQITDCLFQRSHVFRELILDDFQNFFELVLETNVDNPLPPPAKKAKELKNLAAKTLKLWHEKFSDVYKLLDLGFNYLKNCKKVDFVNYSHQTSAQRAHMAQETERQQIFLNKKYIDYVKEMKDRKEDIINCISQLERCLKILKPNDLFVDKDFELPTVKLGERKVNIIDTEEVSTNETDTMNNESDSDESDDEFEEVPAKYDNEEEEIELRYLGFLNDKSSSSTRDYSVEFSVDGFKIDQENQIVIEIMRDLYKELLNSHLVKIKDWIKNFNLVKQGQQSLKEAIEIKNSVQSALKKFEDLKLPDPISRDSEKTINSEAANASDQPGTSKSKHSSNDNKDSLGELNTNKEKRRKEMLKIAPVINLDEVEFCRPVTQQVETDHRFYGRSDVPTDNTNSSLASQQVKTTFVGKFEPVKWTCRAPLRSGKLCPRMDRFKCPLHGKIVARNAVGEIVNESDKNSTNNPEPVPAWLDTNLINDINAAAGKKVIEMPGKKKRKGKGKLHGNLTKITNDEDSPRKRIEKRLFTSKSLNKVGTILDSIERRIYSSKFHHQYNYSLSL